MNTMKLNKLCMFVSMFALSSAAVASDESFKCDGECRDYIEVQEKLDEKDRQIQFMQKEMEIQRLASEIAKIKEGESGGGEEIKKEIERLSRSLNEVYSELTARIEESKANESSDILSEEGIVIDTTGVENIFVTGTSSIGSSWSARVFYNNSIMELYVGDEVFPGAILESISRHGAVLTYSGEEYRKNITPSEVAMARTFNNISEERQLRDKSLEIRLKEASQMPPDYIY